MKLGWTKYIFAGVGLALLAGSLLSYSNTRSFINASSRAEGKVVDLVIQRTSSNTSSSSSSTASAVFKPLVSYTTAAGEKVEFLSSVGSDPPSHKKGEIVSVLYNPDDSSDARIDSFLQLWFMTSMLGGMGILFFLVGGGMIVWESLKRNKAGELRQTGQRILAKFQRIENIGFGKGGKGQSFRIVCQWINPATSQLHVFHSEPIAFDPTDHINSNQVTVFIKKESPNDYLVDLDFLPDLAN